ncbi:hypothetical protein HHI36_001313 [Cryptolaemus montrouzieri]|uniref:Uncharacterized protein n=1 Tax=Cryptolaemus montrouzieri TaxID=559131 RepID=A0ABD2P775_9CUCU
MSTMKGCLVMCLLMLSVVLAFPNYNSTFGSRISRRIHIPALGLGPTCTGCPDHYCDDNPAIVHGYCCGCARFFDNLPVKCSTRIDCPLNGYGLCEDYEYMMYCCC